MDDTTRSNLVVISNNTVYWHNLSFAKFHLYRLDEENSIEQYEKSTENRWTNADHDL